MKKRIGIVGTGNSVSIGYFHAMGLVSDDRCEIVAVLNRSLERSQKFIADLSLNAKAYTNYDEMLDDIDGVIICTPNNSHIEYAVDAMKKHVAVLLEKPMSDNFSKCQQLVDVARETEVFCMIGYTNRFSNQVETLSKFVRENLGNIYTVDITYGGERQANPQVQHEWRHRKNVSGAGALIDYGAHAIDLLNVICNINIAKLNCMTSTFIENRKDENGVMQKVENDDVAMVNAVGLKGEMCSLTMSRVGHNGCEFTIIGEGGKVKGKIKDNKFSYLPKEKNGGFASDWEIVESPPQDMKFGAFEKQNHAFIDGLLTQNSSQICTVNDAFYVEKVLNCCINSNKIGSVITV